jgi:hypothetical protein
MSTKRNGGLGERRVSILNTIYIVRSVNTNNYASDQKNGIRKNSTV